MAEALQTSVAAAGSSQVNNNFTGLITAGGPGVNTIGLRGLGPGRTLSLLNGRRMPPAGVQGQTGLVDFNTIPSLIIDRTEILRDGASTIYGSDAIGGVINLITRRNVDGFELDAYAAEPMAGAAEYYRFGFVWGQTEDRYNFMISAQHEIINELRTTDREWSRCQEDYVFDAATGQRADFIDPRTGAPFCRGRVAANSVIVGGGTVWLPDPTITAVTTGLRPDATPVSIPGFPNACRNTANVLLANCIVALTVPGYRRVFGPVFGQRGLPLGLQLENQSPGDDGFTIYSPAERTIIFGSAAHDLDLFGGSEVFGEILISNRKSNQETTTNSVFDLPASFQGNPWATVLPGQGSTVLAVDRARRDQDVTVGQIVAGIRGSTGDGLFGSWFRNGRWELSAQTSYSDGKYSATNVLEDRFNASLQQTIVNGQPRCPAPTISGGACLPIPWLSPRIVSGTLNDEERAYLFEQTQNTTIYKQSVFEGFVSGQLFAVPAGFLESSAGFHYRTYSIEDTPGVNARLYNTRSGSAGITAGEDSALELYVELEMPIAKGRPFFEDLTTSFQTRYTNYDSYGADTVSKFSVNWQITPKFRFRGTAGQSYRAPLLYEQLLNRQEGFAGFFIDPCINWGESDDEVTRRRCAAANLPANLPAPDVSPSIFTAGGRLANVNLTAETAENFGLGFVWRPETIDLQVALDWSSVEVSNGVANFGGAGILFLCFTEPSEEYQRLCQFITRNPNGTLRSVEDNFRNISRSFQAEVSLNIDYELDLSFGTFRVASETTFQTEQESQLFDDVEATSVLGETGFPEIVTRTQLQFEREDWLYSWTITGISGTNEDADFADAFGENPTDFNNTYLSNGFPVVFYRYNIEPVIYHAASVRYRSDNWTIIGGINNLFDEHPPKVSRGPQGNFVPRLGAATQLGPYDESGRTAFVSVTRRF